MKRINAFILFCTAIAYSQQSAEFKRYQEEHPNAHSIRLNQETKLRISLDKGSFHITEESSEEDLYLDQGANYNSRQSLNFSSFYELEQIEASSYVMHDGKYEEVKVTDFTEKDELDDSFYDDTKSLNFIFPNLNQGSKTTLKYTQVIKDPRFLNAFYFGNFYPIAHSKLTIVADKDIHLDFKEINTEKVPIVFSKKDSRKYITYTWELKNMEEFEYDEDAPAFQSILPHVIPVIGSYTVDGRVIPLLKSVDDLYAWYYTLVKDVNKEAADKELTRVVERLTRDKKNDLEKVRAIYYWTQENIKYIAFEYALGGFVPREANDIFKKKYGDCKDNASILYKMLEIAGIKGHITWIGTRSIPYKYSEVPAPMVDNHMILTYEFGGTTYFLDATGRYSSLELPTSFIQGKEALIALGKDSFKIVKVPVVSSEQNAFKDRTAISLAGNDLSGQSETEISGYRKIDYFYRLEQENTLSEIKEFYHGALVKGYNGFLIDSLRERNKYDYDKNLIVDYSFKVPNYAKSLGNEIYLNLNLNRKLLDFRTRDKRETAIEYDYRNFYDFETTFEIPEGYAIKYLPEDSSLSNDYFHCDIHYQLKGDEIIYRHTIAQHFLTLDTEQQKEVNDLINKFEKQYKEVVVLEKK